MEKTSKRGGRIIHERELLSSGSPGPSGTNTPPQGGGGGDLMPPPPPPPPPAQPTMAEILRNPTKIVMLRVSHRSGGCEGEGVLGLHEDGSIFICVCSGGQLELHMITVVCLCGCKGSCLE